MSHPQTIILVKFKSPLSYEEVLDVAKSRADEFRALTGLTQKYYIQDATTGEYGGLYLWESPEAFQEYRGSALRASIGTAYQVEGDPSIQVLNNIMTLRNQID